MKYTFTLILLALVTTPTWAADPAWLNGKTEDSYEITVYRSATCGCCKGWINHLKDHNFEVKDVVVDNINDYKARYNVPPKASSCHTARINGVTIEGHVPAQDIKTLLAQKNDDIRLLTVPAMPSGTPGMDTPGSPKDAFNVYSIDKDDKVGVYKSYSNY